MSPPLHGSLRKGLPAGQPCRSQDVGKLIEGGSAAPESVEGAHVSSRQAAGGPAGISTVVEAREAGIETERILILEKGPAHSYAIRKFYPEDKRVNATIQRWELNASRKLAGARDRYRAE